MAVLTSGLESIAYNLNNWMNGASLTVTPEELLRKSTSIQGKIKQMESEFESMQMLVDKTGGYWIGEAGDAYRKRYQEYIPDIEVMLRRLKEHVTDLQKMAGVYSEAESAASEIAQSLPADVIV